MRFDSIGMFWQDEPIKKDRGAVSRTMPPIPETEWRPPQYFPDLSTADIISIDTETYDPDLLEHGPGWARHKGNIVGVSIAVPGDYSWYFPVAHTIESEYNLPKEQVFSWLNHTLGNPRQPKTGANLQYDVGWLKEEGVSVKGMLYDVQFMEALLTENEPVSVEALSQKYLGVGKESSTLFTWCRDYYGGSEDQRKNIWRSPPRLVGPYAEIDAVNPLRILEILWPKLISESLLDIFIMECKLIPLLVEMRFQGVNVDLLRAEKLSSQMAEEIKQRKEKLYSICGLNDVNSARELAKAFTALGLQFPLTEKENPSFTKQFLSSCEHPVAVEILEIRKLEKLKGTFIDSYILNGHVNGKVYTSFHNLRGDENGTRSGRFSSSDPNLQNIPIRDEQYGKALRGLFIPEYLKKWRKMDYSQIEYRLLVHHAIGPGSEEVRQEYCNNSKTDYHERTLDKVAPVANWDVSTQEYRKKHRRPVKNINFGLIYGMGKDKLALDLKISIPEAEKLSAIYHKAVPYARATMEEASREAAATGCITTLLGRKSRFELWESSSKRNTQPLKYDQALRYYGPQIQRAYLYRALNRRLQGGAADIAKAGLLKCYEDGYFNYTGVPTLLVHDEFNWNDPGNVDWCFGEIKRILETCVQTRIPLLIDEEIGENWGSCL